MGEIRAVLCETERHGKTLFDTLMTVAVYIARQHPKDGQDEQQRRKNVNAYLNMVDKGHRKLTDDIEKKLMDAIDARLEGEPDSIRAEWTEDAKHAFNGLRRRRRLTPQDADREVRELLRYANHAEMHFIVANTTAENVLASDSETVSPEANDLQVVLIERLGLFVGEQGGFHKTSTGSHNYSFEPKTSYTFCLPDKDGCMKFWTDLFLEVTGLIRNNPRWDEKPTPNEAADAFSYIDGKALTVMVRPVCVNPIPIVGYDLLSPPRAAAFVLSYHSTNKVSVARLSKDDLRAWTYHVYLNAMNSDTGPNIVRWDDVKLGTLRSLMGRSTQTQEAQ